MQLSVAIDIGGGILPRSYSMCYSQGRSTFELSKGATWLGLLLTSHHPSATQGGTVKPLKM